MTETFETQPSKDDNGEHPLPAHLEARFWEQEHRFLNVLERYFESRMLMRGDPRRKAARTALLYLCIRVMFATSAVGVGVLGFVGAYLAYEANSLISKQNQLLSDQSALLDQQTILVRSEYEFERAPFVAFKGSASVPMILVEETWKVARDAITESESIEQLSLPTLVNYGKGPAFDVQVVWSGDDITDLASISIEHRQLYSGDFSEVLEVPSFVEGKHATSGIVKIQYRDLDGKYHETRQAFRCHFNESKGSGLYKVWVDQLLTMPYDPPLTKLAPVLPSWWHH